MTRKALGRVIAIMIIFLFFLGCSRAPHKAPIHDASPIPSHRINQHTVAPGETLYSIAWRYGLDYKSLAATNDLGRGYRIWPGQVLSLATRSEQVDAKPPKPAPKPSAVARAPANKVEVNRSVNQSVSPAPSGEKAQAEGDIKWEWPTKGKVLVGFHGNGGLNKGIDIRGNLGEPVLAAANGEVVYSGSGLRGYGKLVIVKHSDKFLSAYAHNRVLHVAERDVVKAGQKIAEVGDTGTTTAKLHFEIRFDGNPVDPLKYLPPQ